MQWFSPRYIFHLVFFLAATAFRFLFFSPFFVLLVFHFLSVFFVFLLFPFLVLCLAWSSLARYRYVSRCWETIVKLAQTRVTPARLGSLGRL